MDDNILRYDHIYLVAANSISDALDRRGFITENPNGADGLVEEITDIIRKTLEGNCNKTVSTSTLDEIESVSMNWDYGGWEDDLQHQIT